MDLVRQAEVVGRIRSYLEELTGTRIKVRANMGRSKIIEREGILTQTHPALFVVEVQEKRERTARASYQYVDVLTGTVELSDPDNGETSSRSQLGRFANGHDRARGLSWAPRSSLEGVRVPTTTKVDRSGEGEPVSRGGGGAAGRLPRARRRLPRARAPRRRCARDTCDARCHLECDATLGVPPRRTSLRGRDSVRSRRAHNARVPDRTHEAHPCMVRDSAAARGCRGGHHRPRAPLGSRNTTHVCLGGRAAVGADVPFFLHGGAALMTRSRRRARSPAPRARRAGGARQALRCRCRRLRRIGPSTRGPSRRATREA